jgi:hypothetical protein
VPASPAGGERRSQPAIANAASNAPIATSFFIDRPCWHQAAICAWLC